MKYIQVPIHIEEKYVKNTRNCETLIDDWCREQFGIPS
jgi:hypothetical protein